MTSVGAAPNQDCDWAASSWTSLELRYVAGDGDGLATVVGDRAHRSLGGDFVDVTADDPAATLGEFDGERSADSAARTGHHRERVVAYLG